MSWSSWCRGAISRGPSVHATARARRGRLKIRSIRECLSGIAKDRSFRIRRAEVIVPADADELHFYDCAYEELLQSLGLINDDSSLPWSMFNDDVQMGFFDVYDQYLVNILYDPRIRPGMSKAEVDALLPDIFRAVRAWVARANSAKRRQRARWRGRLTSITAPRAGTASAVYSENTEPQRRR